MDKMMHKALSLQDQMLKNYIDQIFQKYDIDKSGALDSKQLTLFYRDLFHVLNIKIQINETMVKEIIHVIDTNNDGVIQKQQLEVAFKILMNIKKPKVFHNQQIKQMGLQVSKCQVTLNTSYNPQTYLSYSTDSAESHFTPTTSIYIRENSQISNKFKSQNYLKPPQIYFKRTQSEMKDSKANKSPRKKTIQQQF